MKNKILLVIFSTVFFLCVCGAIYIGYEGFSIIQQNVSTGVMKITGAIIILYVVKVVFDIFLFPTYTEINLGDSAMKEEKNHKEYR